jgi:hypothetical protein
MSSVFGNIVGLLTGKKRKREQNSEEQSEDENECPADAQITPPPAKLSRQKVQLPNNEEANRPARIYTSSLSKLPTVSSSPFSQRMKTPSSLSKTKMIFNQLEKINTPIDNKVHLRSLGKYAETSVKPPSWSPTHSSVGCYTPSLSSRFQRRHSKLLASAKTQITEKSEETQSEDEYCDAHNATSVSSVELSETPVNENKKATTYNTQFHFSRPLLRDAYAVRKTIAKTDNNITSADFSQRQCRI